MATQTARYREAERRLWAKVGVTPTERFVTLRTGESVRVQEVGEGPPVLFVHGAANAGTSWADLMAALPSFRCIAVDRPGCGMSEQLRSAPLRDLAAVEAYADRLLPDVLDALALPSAHVVATSYGGLFALRGAAAQPARVERLVEMSWLMGAPMAKVPLSMRVAALPGMQAMSTKLPTTRGMVKVMLRQVGLKRALASGRFDDVMIDWFLAVLRDTDTMANDLAASPQIITPLRGLNEGVLLTDELLARVTMPALFLWGDEDPNGAEAVARPFVDRIPNAELQMIHQAGHAPWIDEPDLCADRIRTFLSA